MVRGGRHRLRAGRVRDRLLTREARGGDRTPRRGRLCRETDGRPCLRLTERDDPALEEVTIRARVRGFLTERHFEEGSFVKKGDLLMVIEEDTYKVALQSAQAKLEVAKASVEKATASKGREIAAAQLALDQAQLGLSQTRGAQDAQPHGPDRRFPRRS